jgi:DMSO/TMAO reductase YedYZ molybdopterin-dependent catalytic subunit
VRSAAAPVILADDQRRTEVVPDVTVHDNATKDVTRVPTAVAAAGQAQVAGAVAAGVALGVGELITGFSTKGQSLVGSVGAEFVDQAGGDVARTAISIFNTGDKPALVVGIVLISLLIGAGLGSASRRRPWAGPAGFGLFGLIGIWSAARDPLASTALAVLAVLLAVAAGSLALWGLLRVAATGRLIPTTGAARASARRPDQPTDPHASRRAFFGYAGAAGAFAVTTGVAGRSLRGRSSVDIARAQIELPAPTNTAVPAASPASLQAPGTASFPVDGLSPYLVPNGDFYRIDTALTVPHIDVATWKLQVTGMVDNPFELSFDDVLAMPQVEQAVTLSCVSNEVGGDLVGNALWQGVPLRDLLSRAGVQSDATQIVGKSVDGFTVGFPTAALDGGRVALLAVGMNGEPLPTVHGYPARLVVAGLYGYVSATKWLSEIRLTTLQDFDAYWVPRGWAKEGPIKTQSRIDVPKSGAKLSTGTIPIAGVAWAPGPGRGVTKVEVQVDDSPWVEATLGPALSDNTWREWMLQWDAIPGDHLVRVRATDGSGQTQTDQRAPVDPDGATGWHSRKIKVSG